LKTDPDEKVSSNGLTDDQQSMCDAFGYYTITQGYRKIPGNKCSGGVDLNPSVHSCSAMGGFFSFRNILILVLIIAGLYFGWPIVEAILIMLPIPDPKDVKDKLSGLVSKSSSALKKPTAGKSAAGYSGNFNQAPESLGESDDEDDIGKAANIRKNNSALNYDSDEDKEGSELISLDGGPSRDRTSTAADNIPRLQKP
jgi:hypothetical protein